MWTTFLVIINTSMSEQRNTPLRNEVQRRKIKHQLESKEKSKRECVPAAPYKTYHHSNADNADSYHLTVTSHSQFSANINVSFIVLFQKQASQQLESGAPSFSVDNFTFLSWQCYIIILDCKKG